MRSNGVAIAFLSAALVATGCHKRPTVVALPPAPPPAPAAPAAPVSPLYQADRAFAAGNYDEAGRGYEGYLRASPAGEQRDQALFHLGLTYVLRPAPSDWQRAATVFKQLIDEYPNSPLKPQANLILSLHSEVDQATADNKLRDQRIKQLTTELDRLKKIDADRRRR